MAIISDYIILKGYTPEEIQTMAVANLAEGWQPFGDLVSADEEIVHNSDYKKILYQPMVKYAG